jgi:hypothetical protein
MFCSCPSDAQNGNGITVVEVLGGWWNADEGPATVKQFHAFKVKFMHQDQSHAAFFLYDCWSEG